MLQQLIRAPFDHPIPGCPPRVLPQSRGYLAGSSRASAANRRAQTKAAATLAEPLRPVLLDHFGTDMAALVRCSSYGETGDGDPMASGGLSPVLALAIATARWPADGERRGSHSHSPHGSG